MTNTGDHQPVSVAHLTADPALTLVSGITSTDGFFKQFAFAELERLASDDSGAARSRREALFADQKYNPNMWASLCRESLLTLGKDYQLFLQRGQPASTGEFSWHLILCEVLVLRAPL